MLKCDAVLKPAVTIFSLSVATIDISYRVTKICIITQKKMMSSDYSQKLTACFTSGSVTNRLQSQALLNGSEELEITVPLTADETFYWLRRHSGAYLTIFPTDGRI